MAERTESEPLAAHESLHPYPLLPSFELEPGQITGNIDDQSPLSNVGFPSHWGMGARSSSSSKPATLEGNTWKASATKAVNGEEREAFKDMSAMSTESDMMPCRATSTDSCTDSVQSDRSPVKRTNQRGRVAFDGIEEDDEDDVDPPSLQSQRSQSQQSLRSVRSGRSSGGRTPRQGPLRRTLHAIQRVVLGAEDLGSRDVCESVDFDAFIGEEMMHLRAQNNKLRRRLEALRNDGEALDLEQARVVLRGGEAGLFHAGLVGRLYHGILWMRFPFAFLAASLLLVAFMLGILVNLSFSTFLSEGKIALDRQFRFAMLPVWCILAAILINACMILFFDSVDSTPMCLFRGVILAGFFGVTPSSPPGKRLCFVVDFMLLAWFEVYPITRSLANRVGWQAGYCLGLVESSLFSAAVMVVADFVVAVRTAGCCVHPRYLAKDLRYSQRWLRQVMEAHSMRPSLHTGLYSKHAAFQVTAPEAEDPRRSFMLPEDQRFATSRMYRVSWFLFGIFLWWSACIYAFGFGLPFRINVGSPMLFFVVSAMSYNLRKMLHTHSMGGSYALIIGFLAFVGVILLSGTTFRIMEIERGPLMFVKGRSQNGHGLNRHWHNDPDVQKYPVCDMQWGGRGEATLRVTDLLGLSFAAYARKCWDHEEGDGMSAEAVLLNSFGKRARLRFCNSYRGWPPRSIVVHFPGNNEKDCSASKPGAWVVAVKGTSSLKDIYTDIYLYATVQVLQWIDQHALPVLTTFPLYLVQQILTWRVLGNAIDKGQLWEDLVANVSDISYFVNDPHACKTDPIILTGHSIGGAIASIVASRLGLQGVVFSAPGNMLLSNLFKMRVQKAQKYINVIPQNDLVPQVDQHYAAVQPILCRTLDGHEASSVLCHQLKKSACELWRVCGDAPYHRDFSGNCGGFVTNNLLGKDYPLDDNLFQHTEHLSHYQKR